MIEVSAYTKNDECFVKIKHKSFSIDSRKKLQEAPTSFSVAFVVLFQIILLFFKLLRKEYFRFGRNSQIHLIQNE